ncbi:IS66 family insertion sequence element accessory protein TnpB, partial [Caballeronia sp. AAUFL_F1_KS47]
MTKRLETSRFIWPDRKTEVMALTSATLHALLDGDDITSIRGYPRE